MREWLPEPTSHTHRAHTAQARVSFTRFTTHTRGRSDDQLTHAPARLHFLGRQRRREHLARERREEVAYAITLTRRRRRERCGRHGWRTARHRIRSMVVAQRYKEVKRWRWRGARQRGKKRMSRRSAAPTLVEFCSRQTFFGTSKAYNHYNNNNIEIDTKGIWEWGRWMDSWIDQSMHTRKVGGTPWAWRDSIECRCCCCRCCRVGLLAIE